jgi:CTP:molybdopterin cytidylyltransferase MocA
MTLGPMTAGPMTAGPIVGLVLAAGEGRRLGMPKALVTDGQGVPWLARAVATLRGAGVVDVQVVIGAAAERVRAVVPGQAHIIEATEWEEGMGASLRAGLRALSMTVPEAAAAVIMLVDTPGTGPDVVRRLLEHASPAALVRATYAGRPGHPVLIGREHWAGVVASASGDRGAREYLASHHALGVECGDLADGADIDTPSDLDRWTVGRGDKT